MFYSYDKSLVSFIREKTHHPSEQMREELWDSCPSVMNRYLNVLLRVNEYLQSQKDLLSNDSCIGDSNQNILPQLRDSYQFSILLTSSSFI